MIFAEASNAFMGQLVYAMLAFLGGVGSVVAFLAYSNRNEKRTRRIEPNPLNIKVTAKRYNHDLAEERYEEVSRRLDKHDEEIKGIQQERAKSLTTINNKFERVLIGLTRIATKMGVEVPQPREEHE